MDGPVRVVLVRPPQRVPYASHSRISVPPLSLAYLGSTLLARGVDVKVLDCVGEAPFQVAPLGPRFLRYGLSDDKIVERLPADADVIGVTCMFSEEWPLIRHVLQLIRRAFPHALLVAGGEHITALPEFCLRDGGALDICALGEGEETMAEIAERVTRGEDPRSVDGIAYLEDGRYRSTGRRMRVRDLTRLPPPAWHLIPMENYLRHGFKYGLGRERTVPLLVSRGCPYQCTFCSSPQMWTTRWVARSPDEVLEEMESAIRTYRAQNFDLYDLTAVIKRDWIVEFTTKLIEKGWGVTWQIPSGTRSEALDAEVLSLLRRSGCSFLPYAPESGSAELLARLKKRVRLDRMKESIRTAVRAGLRVKCNIVMGFPEETPRDMLRTIRFCMHAALLGVHDIHVLAFCPYPGSELHEEFVRSGRISRIDDAYFDQLAGMSELTAAEHWSEHVSARQLLGMRMAALAVFYGVSFLARPWRMGQVAYDLVTGRDESRLAKALRDLIKRVLSCRRPRRSGVPPEPQGIVGGFSGEAADGQPVQPADPPRQPLPHAAQR